jgi:hypothetical protein
MTPFLSPPAHSVNWTAVHALIQTFAIAHNAYVVSDDQAIFVYEPDKIIFQAAKFSVVPCGAEMQAACVCNLEWSFPPTMSMKQLGKHVAAAYNLEAQNKESLKPSTNPQP